MMLTQVGRVERLRIGEPALASLFVCLYGGEQLRTLLFLGLLFQLRRVRRVLRVCTR